MEPILFIPARNFTPANRTGCRLIVIHSMESPEKPGTARAVAKWFAGPISPRASAHFSVDNSEVIRCVLEKDIAWAAPGANNDGLHVELAGYAKQTAADWDDAYSRAELSRAAELCADIAQRYQIPPVRLTVDEVRDGKTKGFCSHKDVSDAFKKSTHQDPGQNFPWQWFLHLVDGYLLEPPVGGVA